MTGVYQCESSPHSGVYNFILEIISFSELQEHLICLGLNRVSYDESL